MTKKINNEVWNYNDADGWYSRGGVVISRSEENQNIWVRWNGKDYRAGSRHKTLRDAAADVRQI
jgi:Mor family transcriptional regulator